MRGSTRKRSGRSFDSVPADDGFRNYMSRKIELQRKQFGLVLPPPPPQFAAGASSSSGVSDKDEPLELTTNAKVSCSDDLSEPQLARGSTTDHVSPINTKKLVRFHTNLERMCPVPTSVSDVLENLKHRHSRVHKSSLRKRKNAKLSSSHEKKMH